MDSSSSSPLGVRSTCSEEDRDGIGTGKAEKLSQDLVVEILVRLPVKTLLRFKSVSKLWYSLITSPNFISLHCTHSYRKKKVSLLFLRMVVRGPEATVSFRFDQFVEDLTIPFREADVKIVGCFNGVVCLSVSYRPQRYALWNPATRQLTKIEFPKEMAQEEEEKKKRLEHTSFSSQLLLIPGRRRVWVSLLGSGRLVRGILSCVPASRVNRYMHCRVAIFRDWKFNVADDMYILNYDMIGGVFERIEMPFRPKRPRVQLANCSGSLALFVTTLNSGSVFNGEDDDAWVMNDCGGADQSWSKLVTCKRPRKVGPGVEVFIESNDELVIVREPRLSVGLKRCYPYSESLASLY